MWAILPIKRFELAKQRLATLLSAAERERLMDAMLHDVLRALCASAGLDGILLVSREPKAAALAREFGAGLYSESPRSDLSEAVQAAGGYLMAHHGATSTMIVPGDLPLASANDLAAIRAQHRQLTLVPDGHGEGTNCIVSSPPNLIRYRFDGHSFKPHLEAAYAIGVTPRICRSTPLGLDIDTPADLAQLLRTAPEDRRACATLRYLEASGIASRLRAPHNHECTPGSSDASTRQ